MKNVHIRILKFTMIVAHTAAFLSPIKNSINTYHRNRSRCLLSDSSNLLYQEAEKVLVNRGELEETLVTDAIPIEANVVKLKGVGKAGGFGGGSTSSASSLKKTNTAEAKAHSKVLLEEGVVRIDNVLSDNVADQLRSYLYDLRQTS